MATAQSDIQNKIRKGKSASEKDLEDYLEIADEKVSAEQIKLSSEEDLESLLKLAEELKEKINNPESRMRKLRFYQIWITFLVILFVITTRFDTYSSTPNSYYYSSSFLFFVIVTFAGILVYEFLIQKTRQQILSDKLALKEVLQLLREVHGTIAEREDWSILKRAEFRIRLSRFDLSEKKDSVFNFFS